MDKVILTGESSTARHELMLDGVLHHYENRIFPLDKKYLLCMCRDISQQWEAEQTNAQQQKELKAARIKAEEYMDDASEEFKALEKKLNHDLDRDLDYFSSDIKKMIATEIIKRYYYQRGNIIQQLKDDDGLKEAMKILNDPVKYKEMLSAPAAKE